MVERATREALGETLVELGKKNPNIVVLDADLAKSTTTIKFKEAFPERFIECGIAEQNMMDIAAGLATCGKICFTGSFAIFVAGRAFEQIRNTIAYANLNVKICPTHAGITVGADGASHQTVEDIALMRAIPNMKIIVPADYIEAREAIKAAVEIEGPVFIRLGREKCPVIFDENYKFRFGKASVLKEGKDISIFAMGVMVKRALDAAKALRQEGIGAEVINVSSLKPLDEESVLKSVSKTGVAVTAEEHSVIGGLGSAISEVLAERKPVLVRRIGINDEFGFSASAEELLSYFGLTSENIVKVCKEVLKKK